MIDSSAGQRWRYPPTDRDDVVEVRHGSAIVDPYRWLEDPYSTRTREWVETQQRLADDYLTTLESRPWFADQLSAILGAARAGAPKQRGGRYLRYHNDGSQEQDTLYVADDLEKLLTSGRVLVDPAEFAADGRVSISSVTVSPDGRWLAYGLCEAGSDWIEWRVRDIDTGVDTADRVSRSKFCVAEWLPDSSGFLYWAYPEQPRATGEDATALGAGRLLLHRLGTVQSGDEVIYHRPEAPRERAVGEFTEDGRWLVLSIAEGTARRNRMVVRLVEDDSGFGPELVVVPEPTSHYVFAGSDGDLLYLRTDESAPQGRLLAVDLTGLATGGLTWRELVGERDQVLTSVRRAGDGFLAVYLDDACHRLYRISRDGTERVELVLPGPLSVVEASVHAGDDEAFVGVTSFVDDVRAYRLDLAAGAVLKLPVDSSGDTEGFPISPTLTQRRYATTADGTRVPYFLVRRADLPTDVPMPTLLYGYGGFNQAMTPSFKPVWPAWVEAGGVLAVANLRGGGEFGREWYEAGTRERKQNVFDDFIAVGEDLIACGVTTSGKLALHGRSNGGLLVGAVMTQRPELAAVALPMVGVLDMLRFHEFTIGWAWISDYGDPAVAEDFEFLRAYSPLHNLRVGTRYPATLVLTGDHDDRVVPAHSLKFAAALQHAHVGDSPVLARIEPATGHGMGKPRRAQVAETADLLAFAATHTGLTPGKPTPPTSASIKE